jgi:predicted GH43/DUF377 family glycosyl hydrolase
LDGKFYVFYTALSAFPFTAASIRVGVAVTNDFQKIDEKHPVTPFNAKAMSLFPEKINGRFAVVLTANTDIPPSKIAVAYFDREEQMWSPSYWMDWYASLNQHTIHLQRSSKDHVEAGAPPIKTKDGWLFIYSYIHNYLSPPAVFGVEAVLLDLNDPRKIIARTDKPLLVPQEKYEKYGKVPNIVFPTGALVKDGILSIYYGAADNTCAVATCKLNTLLENMLETRIKHVKLERFPGNPVLKPNPNLSWQARAVFNPAVLYEDGRVHLAYRAMSADNTSVIGFASSANGFKFDEQLSAPVNVPREEFEAKLVPGGNSGCEDPRLTRIDDTIYMLYTAFNGRSDPRVALTHISLDDFIKRRWVWSRPILISPPNLSDKDAAIFPKKIKGKYAILHRLGTSIWLDFVDDLKFDGDKWLGGHIFMSPKDEMPDTDKLGISGPPIETKYGWLLLYHAVSRKTQPMTYYVSAALLDLNDPSKVIARRKVPILEPETPYELFGQVNNVVFPCGAAIIGKDLFVYYGGADSVIGVATMKIEDLLKSLLSWGEIGNDAIKPGKFKWGTFSFTQLRKLVSPDMKPESKLLGG